MYDQLLIADNEKVLDMLINNDKLINQADKKGNNTPAHLAALNSKYRLRLKK